jgi:integrase
MPTPPTRRKLETGIYERVDATGRQLGLEIVYKDQAGKTRRRTVSGNLQSARDALAVARTRRVKREAEPLDPRVSFNAVADAFERSHVAGLRPNSRQAYGSALRRLRATFGVRRITSITKADVRAFIAAERDEGLKANTIIGHLAALSAVYTFAAADLEMPVSMPKLKPSERPRAADDAREHRVLTDAELARVLQACDERSRLYFRTLAETGARASEALGLTAHRVAEDGIAFREQLARSGDLAPLKTRQSRRTIEVTRGLAAELRLAAGPERVFEHLTHRGVERAWSAALERAALPDPQPVVHDLRHTHVSGLIADDWDPVEVAQRIGDTLETTLRVYAHEFDSRRRAQQRRSALEARYGVGMATSSPQQSATDVRCQTGDVADLQAIRDTRQQAATAGA